jgi:hypothetical protein
MKCLALLKRWLALSALTWKKLFALTDSPLVITHNRSPSPLLAVGLRVAEQVSTQRGTEKSKTWCMRLKQYLLTAQSFVQVALQLAQWAQIFLNYFLVAKERSQ